MDSERRENVNRGESLDIKAIVGVRARQKRKGEDAKR